MTKAPDLNTLSRIAAGLGRYPEYVAALQDTIRYVQAKEQPMKFDRTQLDQLNQATDAAQDALDTATGASTQAQLDVAAAQSALAAAQDKANGAANTVTAAQQARDAALAAERDYILGVL